MTGIRKLAGWPYIVIVVFSLIGAAFATGLKEQVIFRLPVDRSGGATPEGGLIADAAGNFYATAGYGGAFSQGAVFEISPPAQPTLPWTETVLYNFTGGEDGGTPGRVTLAFDSAGNLYGTTMAGGSAGLGVVFELSPPSTQGGAWTESVLHSFAGGSDGSVPWAGVVFDSNGNLYGMTDQGGGSTIRFCGKVGCGTVFEMSPPATSGGAWTETVLHVFSSSGYPTGGLTIDPAGNLYGTTFAGETDGGLAFKMEPPSSGDSWTFTPIFSFTNNASNGSQPNSDLIFANGSLYGMAEYGGFEGSSGVVYELSPPQPPGGPWTETVLYAFGTNPGDGFQPLEGLTFDKAGNLYGTNYAGGDAVCDCGTVFELSPPSTQGGAWTETILHAFTGHSHDGGAPYGPVLIGKYGQIFGTTVGGIGQGAVYEITR
jgi:uncharacterized repeat protein (TIGR03803 family)